MNPSTSLGTRSNVGMAKPSPPVRQAGNIWCLLEIHGVCRRSVPSGCAKVKYKCRCRVIVSFQPRRGHSRRGGGLVGLCVIGRATRLLTMVTAMRGHEHLYDLLAYPQRL